MAEVPESEIAAENSSDKLCSSPSNLLLESSEELTNNNPDEVPVDDKEDLFTYTDPNTKAEYVWNHQGNCWDLKDATDINSHSTNYKFDGRNYTYTDENTQKKYIWDTKSNSWIEETKSCRKILEDETEEFDEEDSDDDDGGDKKKTRLANRQDMTKGKYGYDCDTDTRTYTDPSDGTVYIWDTDKQAWFPKIDDTFMAYYQMNYGFTTNTTTTTTTSSTSSTSLADVEKEETISTSEIIEVKHNPLPVQVQTAVKRKAEPQNPKWFELDEKHNTKVYVSNLPLTITEQEFVDLMQKCGLVMKDVDSGKMKVKLYTEPDGKQLKGDALCTYIKKESVDLALQLLDGSIYNGHKLKVEKAKFSMKGEAYDPTLKPKKKRKKDVEKLKKMQQKLFDWRPDKMRGERSKHECVVIVKNFVDPKAFKDNVSLLLEYRADLTEECSKCGAVRKVVIHDKHPEGVAQVWFKEAEAADACVQLLNGRWFEQRQITAFPWDGKTKYKIEETKEEREARLKQWEEFLTESNKNKKISIESVHDDVKNENFNENNNITTLPINKPVANRRDEQINDNNSDSDGTRSSAGSGDETDEEKMGNE